MTDYINGILKTIYAALTLSALTGLSLFASVEPEYLAPSQRSKEVQEHIERAFTDVNTDTCSSWGIYNGASSYGMIGNDEHITDYIIEKSPKKREFYLIDIGAGNFQWGRQRAKELNSKYSGRDVKFHIIGVRGEKNSDPAITEIGNCILYELGSFKIEDIAHELGRILPAAIGNIDIMVSQWTFRHLVDPVGTFVQAYNLLTPETGLAFMDGFFFSTGSGEDGNSLMEKLLEKSGAPFLIIDWNVTRSLNRFIIRRSNSEECRLPMRYSGVEYYGDVIGSLQVGSGCITGFEFLGEDDLRTKNVAYNWVHNEKRPSGARIKGSEELYLYLREVIGSVYKHALNDWDEAIVHSDKWLPYWA